MSAETPVRLPLRDSFNKFTSTLPVRKYVDNTDFDTVPAYKGVRIHGRALGLAVNEFTEDFVAGDTHTILITLDGGIAATAVLGNMADGPGMAMLAVAGSPVKLDRTTSSVTEASGAVADAIELRRWLLQALHRATEPTTGAHA